MKDTMSDMNETTPSPSPAVKRGRGRPKKPAFQTHQVTFRMPEDLYQKLHRIAESIYQSDYVIFRMALSEFARNYKPAKHQSQGISLLFPIMPLDKSTEPE